MSSKQQITTIQPPSIPDPAAAQQGRKQTLLEQICRYIQENMRRKVTLREVAAHFGVSVSTVTQLFQKQAGITFHQYLTQCRLVAASELIHSGTALEEAGRQVGYSDHSTFYRAFHQHFGISPREFRRKQPE